MTDDSRVALVSYGIRMKIERHSQGTKTGLGDLALKPVRRLGSVSAYFDRNTYNRPVRRFSEWMHLKKGLDWQGGNSSYPGHSGTDFCLLPGTPILAMAGGMVTRIHNDLKGGLSVFIDHGGGVGTSYRHCSVITRSVGQWVARGDVIALSGTSGIMRLAQWWLPAHVHITVWFRGLPVDPFGESENAGDKGFWIDRNAPRPAQPDDVDWDYHLPWQLRATVEILKQAEEQCPIMWSNFSAYAKRMLPQNLSCDSGERPYPRLTLPFRE